MLKFALLLFAIIPSIALAQVKPAISKDSTAVSTSPATTSDGTGLGTSMTTKTTTDGTAAQTAPVIDPKKLPKRKVIYKTIDPGFKSPPLFRLSAMGPNAVWGGVGIKAGLTDNSTGGFLVNFGYSYRITRKLWADAGFSVNFGGDCSTTDPDKENYNCGGMNGFGLDILGGLMWRFLGQPKWDLPLNPYIKALGGVSFIISNGPNDGFAPVVKGVGGARYSFTDEFAVGAELGITFGASFRNVSGSGVFMALDFLISAEYAF